MTFSAFEAVNRKNNVLEVLDRKNGGNWTVHGEEIAFSLTDCACHELNITLRDISI